MYVHFMRRSRKSAILLIAALALVASAIMGVQAKPKPTITLSENVFIYKVTKKISISGSGFTPGSVVILGVEGLGKFKKHSKAAKDLWAGLATVKEDGAFEATVSLGGNLWRVRGLSGGGYTFIAKNDLGEMATVPITIKKKTKKKK